MSVGFFFIVSGFLLAMSTSRMNEDRSDIAKEDLSFIWKKIRVILPYHLIACTFAVRFSMPHALSSDNGIETLIDRIPSIFFLQAFQLSGSDVAFLGVEWYISVMIVVMFILFPFLMRYKRTFTGIIAPVVGLALLGLKPFAMYRLLFTVSRLRMKNIKFMRCCYYV